MATICCIPSNIVGVQAPTVAAPMVNCACVVSYCMSGWIVCTGATAMNDDEDGWTVVKRHRRT